MHSPNESALCSRILVVDDNREGREYVRIVLQAAGHAVLEADDGDRALELVLHEKPDLVITDLLMPRMDGFELIRRLRGEPETVAMRIIVLSATFREQEARTLGEALGVGCFLVKPVLPDPLLAAVDAALREPALPHPVAGPVLDALNNAYRNLMGDALFRKTAELEREIAARQHLEQELRRSEQRISGIVATAMDAIVTIDAGQRIVLFNAAAEAMFGCPALDAIGTSLGRFLPERYRASHGEHVQRFLAGGATARAMGRLQSLAGLRADGLEFPIEAAISKVQAGGDLLATVVVRDISARRAAESALQESEQRLRLAQQIGRIGSFERNLVTGVMRWSAEIAALYGLPPKTMETADKPWRQLVHPDDLPELDRRIAAALQTGSLEGEWRVVWPDGSVRWLAGRAVVYRDDAGRPQRMLGVNIDITERKEAEDRIRRVAQHDALTGLPNRALVYEFGEHLLSAMRRNEGQAACLFVDLDRFKPINDTYGHEVGDLVLREVGRRLSACVRGEDLVGRIGGDEFVALLAPVHGDEDAARIAMHILGRLGRPIPGDGVELQVSPSIGISLFPQDGASMEELIRHADAAMYAVKQGGRNGFQFFQAELNERSEASLRIENRLRRALEFGEFELFLQPVMDLASGKPVAAEALVRWIGMDVPPRRFIPVAESAGLMQPLGEWILQEACRLRRRWRDRGLATFPVSINISPVLLRQRDFPRNLARAMEEAGLEPADLKLEVTESTLINHLDEAVSTLQTIRDMGVGVALDDFGTGYSSLSALTRLPLDSVKLDQSFVRDLGGEGGQERGQERGCAVVAESVITLATSLGLAVVAEGIETDAALVFLKAHRCQQGQGYLFSRPLPAREFEHWCRRLAA